MSYKDKILKGYAYSSSPENKMRFVTGYGGAIEYGDALENVGASNEEIEKEIHVFVRGKYIPLSELSVVKKGDNISTLITEHQDHLTKDDVNRLKEFAKKGVKIKRNLEYEIVDDLKMKEDSFEKHFKSRNFVVRIWKWILEM